MWLSATLEKPAGTVSEQCSNSLGPTSKKRDLPIAFPPRNYQHGISCSCFEAGRGLARDARSVTRVHGGESSWTLDGGGGFVICIVDDRYTLAVLCADLYAKDFWLGWYVDSIDLQLYQARLTVKDGMMVIALVSTPDCWRRYPC
jgi:hypothetical protein